MSELLKRALEVCNELSALRDRDAVVGVIEQALLAERRSVWEKAEAIVRLTLTNQGDQYGSLMIASPDADELGNALRAAAEKEVGK